MVAVANSMGDWARHIASSEPRYHRIVERAYGGSTVTACGGRWPTSDAIESHDDPHPDKRCRACTAAIAADAIDRSHQ